MKKQKYGNDLTVFSVTNKDDAGQLCAHEISALLLQHTDQNIHLLVSGGSVANVLQSVSLEHVGPHVTMCIIDERFSVNKEDENYYQLSQTTFARSFVAAGGIVCNTSLEGMQTLEEAEQVFTHHFSFMAEQGSVVIALMGIGADGHTAGMMPYPEDEQWYRAHFYDKEKLAVAYDAGEKNTFPLRVTASAEFLKNYVHHAIVYAVGDEKKNALQEVLKTSEREHEIPARVLHEMNDAKIYTDQNVDE